MSEKHTLTAHQIDQAREWQREGVSWREMGKRFGTTQDTVRRAVDAEFSARERAMRENRRRSDNPRGRIVREKRERQSGLRPTEAEFQAMKALIPADTRDLTGFLTGSPLPGRSALDKLRAEGRWL